MPTKKTQPKTKKVAAKKPTVKKVKVESGPSKAEILVSGVHTLHDEALELAESVVFMAAKLEESRKVMKNEPIVIPYDNGGGQTGVRENPAFTAYEKLLATYTKSLTALRDVIGDGAPKEMSALDDLRRKFQVVK